MDFINTEFDEADLIDLGRVIRSLENSSSLDEEWSTLHPYQL